MIPVTRAPEPVGFHRRVRQPGRKFLQRRNIPQGAPSPTGFVFRRYWSRAIPMLHASYNDICAYLAVYLEPAVDANGDREGSVEHIIPKAQDAWQAYEWDNFLLADRRVNSDRGQEPLTCPFDLDFHPFQLFLDSGIIDVADDLTEEQEDVAYEMLDVLQLDKEVYDAERAEYYARYADQDREDVLTSAEIARYAPFIWYEIRRQNLEVSEN